MGAKRALGRWGWRLLRREWRQQLLILALISTSIAVASVMGTLLFHAEQPASAFTGTATHRLFLDPTAEEAGLASQLARLRASFVKVEITLVTTGNRDGTTTRVAVESPPATSVFGAEPVRLLAGRYPQQAGELALSTPVATSARAIIGHTMIIDGKSYEIVGLVEDPSALNRPFAIASHSEEDDAHYAVALVQATSEELMRFNEGPTPGHIDFSNTEQLTVTNQTRLVPMVAVLVMTAIALLEIALLCSAGFIVLSQHRVRQFGLIGAVGASPTHLRMALRLNGLIIGLAGGAVGIVVGFAISLAARPMFERLMGHRISAWSMPWAILIPMVLLAGATGLLAAWWPSRSLAKNSIVNALAARPLQPASNVRWLWTGLICFVGGSIVLASAAQAEAGMLTGAALIVAVVGLLALTPAVASIGGSFASHLPVGPRLALRDLARHPNRSAAALASLVIALAIPTAITITSAAADAGLDRSGPNLPDNWAVVLPDGVFGGHLTSPIDGSESELALFKQALPLATITEVSLATTPGSDWLLLVGHCHGDENERTCPGGVGDLPWVATPELLGALGLDPSLADAKARLVGTTADEVSLITRGFGPGIDLVPQVADLGEYRAVPNYFVPQGGLESGDFVAVPVGWLITNPTPITPEQSEALFSAVARDEPVGRRGLETLVVEVQQPDQDDADIRRNTVIVGVLLALTVIASMISLLRVDSRRVDQTLTAIGAPSSTRRTVAASTTAFLAFGGSLLALPGGYLALLAITSDQSANYPFVFPAAELGALLLGVPVLATLTSAALVRNGTPPSRG